MKKTFSTAMLIISSMIGAGFASGKEIVSFLGVQSSPITAIICGLIIFLVGMLFLTIGKKVGSGNFSDVNIKIGGRFHYIIDIVLLFNSLIVLSGMLAAADSLGGIFFPMRPVYSLVLGGIAVLVVSKGVKGLIRVSRILIPLIIIILVFVCFSTIKTNGGEAGARPVNIISCVIYICMNMMLAGTVLTTLPKTDTKTIVLAPLICGIIMGALIFLIMAALGGSPYANSDLPILELAKTINPVFFVLVIIVLVLSIFSAALAAINALTQWFSAIFTSKIFSAVIVLIAALILSFFGFSKLVALFYPIIGVLGVVYVALGLVFVLKSSPLAILVSKRFKSLDADGYTRTRRKKTKIF